jgi:CheY-like chemotaxis protein
MPRLPHPGQRVCWRDSWHAHALRWLYTYGPGPFEVVGVVDKSHHGLPNGLFIKTDLGRKEVSEVWLAEEPAGGSWTPPSGMGVLLVDDDRDAVDSLSLLVRFWVHRPLVAYDVDTALGTALRERPEVVVLDLGMAGVDGWELARRLRAEQALEDVVLLAVTGYGTQADQQKSFAAGMDQHLLKPVEPDLICRLLEVYLARQRQRLALS